MLRPDMQVIQTMTVKSVENCNKTFNSKQGQREKFLIKFVDDYQAEYCPLAGQFDFKSIKEGQPLNFKIVYRKDFSDEIEPIPMLSGLGQPVAQAARVLSMQGHPASLALLAAKDIFCKKFEYNNELVLSDMFADADSILEWLTSKIPQ